ncbi:MAG: hypothetical protein ACO1Q7_15140 [Gemmatimonas sp.]
MSRWLFEHHHRVLSGNLSCFPRSQERVIPQPAFDCWDRGALVQKEQNGDAQQQHGGGHA